MHSSMPSDLCRPPATDLDLRSRLCRPRALLGIPAATVSLDADRPFVAPKPKLHSNPPAANMTRFWPETATDVLFQLKSGRTSAPRLRQAWQTNRASMSDS
jgi:hypothetical protein